MDYKDIFDRDLYLLEEGIAKGMAEGEAKGKAEGMAKGKAEGIAKGKAEGIIEAALKMLKKGLAPTSWPIPYN